jgi:hypothetical protein
VWNEVGNSEALWPIAEPLIKRDEPKASTAIYGPSGFKFRPLEKTNVTADSLWSKLTPHDLRDENDKKLVEARVQAVFEAVGNDLPERTRPCDVLELISTFLAGLRIW